MRFKVDENLPGELAQLLRDTGWDALTVVDEQLSGTDDELIRKVCSSEDRTLLTFDRGFGDIRTLSPEGTPGFIVFRLRSQEKPHVLHIAEQVITLLRTRRCDGELWIVEETRIRIRKR